MMTETTSSPTLKIHTQHGAAGLHSPRLAGFDRYVVVDARIQSYKSRGGQADHYDDGIAIRVYDSSKELLGREVIWCRSRWNAEARNRMGRLGASESIMPSNQEIERVTTGLLARIERELPVRREIVVLEARERAAVDAYERTGREVFELESHQIYSQIQRLAAQLSPQ